MGKSILDMSDEELMNMSTPPVADEPTSASAEVGDDDDNQDENDEPQNDENNSEAEPENNSEAEVDEDDDDPENDENSEVEKPEDKDDSSGSETKQNNPLNDKDEDLGNAPKAKDVKSEPKKDDKPKDEPKKDDEKKPDDKSKEAESNQEVDYKAAYEKVMTFRANGKEIKLKDIGEAVRLMEMGANYTKKLQALQPQAKILRMLENNKLLDEDKLNHLIDISRGDKNAIQKLLADRSIDPMDFDENGAKEYKAGNHKVTDKEIELSLQASEVSETPEGQAIIIDTQKKFDQSSREIIFADPTILTLLTEHKRNGIYDAISNEVERRRMLRDPTILSLPFLHAYKAIGDDLATRNLLPGQTQPEVTQKTEPKVEEKPVIVARGTAPKKPVANGDKAKAAGSTRTRAKPAAENFNPLAMSDEEFLTKMANRL